MNRQLLYTIGYEGAELTDFLATLQKCDIKKVLDIRDLPLSRKRGFSKTALTEALASKGISYVHLRALGDPKPGRDAARRGDFSTFRRIFGHHLGQESAQAALREAGAIGQKTTSVLLCYERAHEHCHRAIVAKALSDSMKFEIRHIGVIKDAAGRRKAIDDHESSGALALG